MRITQSMVTANTLNNINTVYANLEKYQNQASTGKKITLPSDDPIAATNGMYYTSESNAISQYQNNVSTLQNWMSNSGTAISQVSSDISKIHTLVVQASNGTLNANDQSTIATEIESIKQDLLNTANTQVAGNYIFHGSAVTSSPVSTTTQSDGSQSYSVDTTPNDLNIAVSNGVSIRANVNQGNIFGSGQNNILNTVNGIIDDLKNNPSNLSNDLSSLDTYTNNISAEQADLGARQNQVDSISNRLTQQQTSATQGLSNNIDVDFEQAVMNMSTQQTAYQAALSVGAKIIQPSLLDYLGGSVG